MRLTDTSVSVDFLRRSLKDRPNEREDQNRSNGASLVGTGLTSSSSTGKRRGGADWYQSDDKIDVYDEACREIRLGLGAYAVAVVDLSQFHLFYPSLQNSSTHGVPAFGRSTSGQSRSSTFQSSQRTGRRGRTPKPTTEVVLTDETDVYAQTRKAKETYSVAGSLAPSRTPQVLFMDSRPPGSKALQIRHQDDVSRSRQGRRPDYINRADCRAGIQLCARQFCVQLHVLARCAQDHLRFDHKQCRGGYPNAGASLQIR